ncbi:putative DNA repair protein, Swi5 protein [Trachipleistophora hominis]|uniref:Putative DNA repair protein, Swi5 protein n=1 Tax=Trachipleistophora hominis TaxID=72359 RepID=L7JYZ4_TRAHO|nr:putative DNA repair protein, Swi5 protein [Trachipleistophora hominis]
MISELNNWQKNKIIHKSKITAFDFLLENHLIKHIDMDYYYAVPDIENQFYKVKCESMNMPDDVEAVVKNFIRKLNTYNELKDCCESLVGKIAELRGVRIKDVREEFELPE